MGSVWGGAARERRLSPLGEDGFTLLELIVVVSIIAVLLTIAIPTYLRARSNAQEGAAQSDLRTALVAANTVFITAQSFANVQVSDLTAAEPSLHWQDGRYTDGAQTLAVDLSSDIVNGPEGSPVPAILLAEDAGDGVCWYALQTDDDAPWYGSGRRAGGRCDADDAVAQAGTREL
jgi:prepilin-type N-terminal cleavage/methylation domain-containing protein